jgi:hypothetical protein
VVHFKSIGEPTFEILFAIFDLFAIPSLHVSSYPSITPNLFDVLVHSVATNFITQLSHDVYASAFTTIINGSC